jgi:hypothetical protein
LLFPALAHEVVLVAHDCVDGDIVRTVRFALSTGMSAV